MPVNVELSSGESSEPRAVQIVRAIVDDWRAIRRFGAGAHRYTARGQEEVRHAAA